MKTVIRLLFLVFACSATVGSGLCQTPLGNSRAVVLDMKLVQDKDLLIATLGETIEVWNYKSRTLVKRWNAPKIVAIDYRAGKLAGASATGKVFVWDVESATATMEKAVANAPLIAIAWLNDEYFAVSGENNAVLKIQAGNGEVVSNAPHRTTTTALTCMNDETLIAGDHRGVITIYDAKTLTEKTSVKGHKQLVRKIDVSDSLQVFYTASDDGNLLKWSSKTFQVMSTEKMGSWLLAADVIDYSRETKPAIAAVGKRSGELVIDIGSGVYTAHLDAMINAVQLMKNSTTHIVVAVATHGNGIQFWEAKEMKFR